MKTKFTDQQSGSAVCHNELIEACKKGDQKAMLQVYKIYYKFIYRIYLAEVNDPVLAEDLMQESFLSAFENIASYHGDISFPCWLNNYINLPVINGTI